MTNTLGVLVSGGLDSAILISYLLNAGEHVQPFYVDCGLHWQPAELATLHKYLAAIATSRLSPLITLQLPLADLYGDHWSLTGQKIPDAATPDEAVYLPGRNLLLIIKPALWCQMHGIGRLALGVLGSNPFDDTTADFFAALENVLRNLGQPPLEIVRPFANMHKEEVMRVGRRYPLELTFSCIAPVDELHCGRCNKCAERQAAFRMIELPDPTKYAAEN
ncbi:MAG TPA: 7-cyano-7-deazaguanine synthase [Pirellulales bacterium]|jgi:7-cyano-7-deazaguanine synthase|nr:7-cyano-7-deazaguanine synthase [Pirellulales bacterium]